MYCPNCGKQTSVDLNFCRSCGLGLDKIAQSLTDQLPAAVDQSQQDLKEKMQRQGVIALSIAGVGLLSMLFYGVVYRVMILQGRVLQGFAILAFLALLASGLWAVYLFMRASEVGEASKKRRELDGNRSSSPPKVLLEGYLEPVPGVTEGTTELLFANRRERNTKEI